MQIGAFEDKNGGANLQIANEVREFCIKDLHADIVDKNKFAEPKTLIQMIEVLKARGITVETLLPANLYSKSVDKESIKAAQEEATVNIILRWPEPVGSEIMTAEKMGKLANRINTYFGLQINYHDLSKHFTAPRH